MKKNYINPCSELLSMETEQMVAVSGVGSAGAAEGITYGGVSSGDTHTPDVKREGYSVWNDDWSR